jgi:hypothetical protein
MPLISRTFDQLIDFTRTSAATYFNSAGLMTLTPPSVNLLTYTQEFDNPAWSKNNTTVVPNQNPAAASLGPELGSAAAINIRPATGGTVTRSGGIITFTSPASGLSTAVSQEVSGLTIGRLYRFNGRMRRTVGANVASPQIRDASGGGGNGLATGPAVTTDWVSFSLYWVANVTTAYFSFASGGASQTIEISEAEYSVREVIGGFITAPDGTLTADKLVETATTTVHNAGQNITTTAALYTFSCYVKAAERTFALLYHTQSNAGVSINLTTGATGTPSGLATPVSSNVTAVGDGWYRVSMTVTATAASNFFGVYTMTSLTGSISYAGDGTSGILVWGGQLEAVPDASLVLGPELVTNPGPFSDTTGWTAAIGTLSTSSGSLVLTIPAGGSSARGVSSAMSGLTIGAAYRINVSGVAGTAATKSIRITTNADGSTGALFTQSIAGTSIIYDFVATATTHYLVIVASNVENQTFSLSQASVKQATSITNMPSAYAKNVGGLFPARFDYDPVTLAPRGFLIEEQRTNLILRSQEFDNAVWAKAIGQVTIAPNAGIAPDGTATADRFVSTGGSFPQMSQTGTVAAGDYAFSVWVKSDGTPQIAQALIWGGVTVPFTPTETWQRIVGIRTGSAGGTQSMVIATNTASAAASSFLVWGAQLEAGAFATSYIPTVASTVTRAVDIAAVTAANFSSWYNQPTGTFVVEATTGGDIASTSYSMSALNAASSSIVGFDISASGDYRFRVTDTNVNSAIIQVVAVMSANTTYKTAGAYKAADFAATANGGAVVTDTTGTVPSNMVSLAIGSLSAATGALSWNGHVRSIRYYPARLSNAQLQTLTA